MVTNQPETFVPLTDEQLLEGTDTFGEPTEDVHATLRALRRTYSWRDRFLRPGFVLDEATEILEDISALSARPQNPVNMARLQARRLPDFEGEASNAVKVWATREVSQRRRWIGTLKLWKWAITVIVPFPAFVGANLLVHWITTI